MNRMVTSNVVRVIYSTDENFVWTKLDDRSVGDKSDMFAAVGQLKHLPAPNLCAKPQPLLPMGALSGKLDALTISTGESGMLLG